MKRPSKYKAVRTEVDGYMFASKAEAKRYGELKLLEKAGEVADIRLQPEFILCPWMTDHSDIRVIGKYRGDFAYEKPDGTVVVEDVKGFMTPLAKWKIKHVEAQYGLKVEIIK